MHIVIMVTTIDNICCNILSMIRSVVANNDWAILINSHYQLYLLLLLSSHNYNDCKLLALIMQVMHPEEKGYEGTATFNSQCPSTNSDKVNDQ